MIKSFFWAISVCFMISAYASAADYATISADELKKTMDSGKQLTVVDARTEQEFRQGHIWNAVNIPPDKIRAIAKYLPKSSDALLIFYCRGAG